MVLGATATGKSELAALLAEALGGEVVSFDASCVYRGLDVGTAKPSPELRARVVHHGLDACDPREAFSAARFVALAERALEDIAARGRRAVLAGGTGLYLRALLRGLLPSPEADPATRLRLEERERGRPGSLHRLLRRLDPEAARTLPPADTYRHVRILEHRLLTGRALSEARTQWRSPERLRTIKLGLDLPREERDLRIRSRVDAMLAAGLVEEVRGLLAAGVPEDAPAFRALGYLEVVAHLAGELSLGQVREAMVLRTRQYAKRQDTWFRREEGVTWLQAARDSRELPDLVERAMMRIRSA